MYNALVMLQIESRDVLPVHHRDYIFLKNAQSYNREVDERREQNERKLHLEYLAVVSYNHLYYHLKETM